APARARARFEHVLRTAAVEADPVAADALLHVARAAIAARIQLEVLAEELPELAAAVDADLEAGANPESAGARWRRTASLDRSAGRVATFRALAIGGE